MAARRGWRAGGGASVEVGEALRTDGPVLEQLALRRLDHTRTHARRRQSAGHHRRPDGEHHQHRRLHLSSTRHQILDNYT